MLHSLLAVEMLILCVFNIKYVSDIENYSCNTWVIYYVH